MGSKILWAIVGGFLAGIFLRSFFTIGIYSVGFVIVLAIVTLCAAFFNRKIAHNTFVVAVALIALGAGILRMDSATLPYDPVLNAHLNIRVTLTGIVSDEPDVRETSILVPIVVNSLSIGSTSVPVHAKILAQMPPHTSISYGDSVRVAGTLRTPQPFDTGTGRQFDYPKYLAVSGITYQLTNAFASGAGPNRGNIIKSSAIRLKQIYVAGLAQALPEPEAGLAGGITVGDKRSIGQDLSDVFRRVSLVHIIVLSGYNITIVITAIGRVFAWLPRSAGFGVSGFAVLFFVLMTGGAASATRAGAMALLAMYARVSGRTYLAERALAVVALVMVMWNPFTLAFDPSFQLSALATLGLMTFTPIFKRHLWWITEQFGLREIAGATLGTQTAVLPLLLYQNGTLSLVALPANLLALIPIPLAMLLSFIAAIAGITLGPLAVIIGFPAYALLAYIIGVATVLGSLPFAAISVPAFSALWMFAAYAAMFVGARYLQKNPALSEERAGKVYP